MIELEPLFQFSREHCIAICAFLVPANLFATLQTLLMGGLLRSRSEVTTLAIASHVYALLMVAHVMTWWMVGVVMAPTFILLFLATVCLGINGWALGDRAFGQWVRSVSLLVYRRFATKLVVQKS